MWLPTYQWLLESHEEQKNIDHIISAMLIALRKCLVCDIFGKIQVYIGTKKKITQLHIIA